MTTCLLRMAAKLVGILPNFLNSSKLIALAIALTILPDFLQFDIFSRPITSNYLIHQHIKTVSQRETRSHTGGVGIFGSQKVVFYLGYVTNVSKSAWTKRRIISNVLIS